MSKKGEVLVIQSGNHANFVGSHLWNSRAEAQAASGEEPSSVQYHQNGGKYVPRTIIIEQPNNLGSLQTAEMHSSAAPGGIWGGSMTTAVQTAAKECSTSRNFAK
jgi:hypothetical protein